MVKFSPVFIPLPPLLFVLFMAWSLNPLNNTSYMEVYVWDLLSHFPKAAELVTLFVKFV